VSRAFSKFQDDGILDVRQRHVVVLDEAALRRIVSFTSG
jgi:CRP/FNR family transcriptional regulator, anaerobic regulatory protein